MDNSECPLLYKFVKMYHHFCGKVFVKEFKIKLFFMYFICDGFI